MNSLALLSSNARVCAQFTLKAHTPLGTHRSAFHYKTIEASKLIMFVVIIYRTLLSSAGSGSCWDRFFFKRSVRLLAVLRQEGYQNV